MNFPYIDYIAFLKEKENTTPTRYPCRKEKKSYVLLSSPLLTSLKVRRMLKRTSGLYKLMSNVHRISMKLESEFLDTLQIKAETLQKKRKTTAETQKKRKNYGGDLSELQGVDRQPGH